MTPENYFINCRIRVFAGMVHQIGVEPNGTPNKTDEKQLEDTDGHNQRVALDSDLSKILVAWESLPPALKAAILAIINSVEGVQ